MGSKDQIIHKIAPVFPKADNFYDLFGGGFSVSHYMTYFKKYPRVVYNEIKSDIVELVRDAIDGKYNYNVFKPEWISREDFMRRKDTDAYVRCIWSFGNNQKSYLFGEENEPRKKSLHNAVVFNLFDEFAIDFLGIKQFPAHLSIRGRRMNYVAIARKKYCSVKDDPNKRKLEQLERLQQLERLERLQQLELISKSYDQVEILPNSVIYCDPPYKGTSDYITAFNHDKFWQWVRLQKQPVFVSEYQAPSDIKVIMAINKKTPLSSKGMTATKPEKLFGNDAAYVSVFPDRLHVFADGSTGLA